MMPFGSRVIVSQRPRSSLVKPRSVKSRTNTSGLKMRMTIFSPNAVGIVEIRSSTSSPSGVTVLMRPLFADLHSSEQLDPRRDRRQHRLRYRIDLMQHAVDQEAHQSGIAARLDVNDGGALLECVLPQPVDDVDDVLIVRVEMSV